VDEEEVKEYFALPLAVLLPLATAADCDPSETAPDHSVTCRAPKGYSKAGRAAIAAKGSFYVCLKDSRKVCVVSYHQGGKLKKIRLYRSDFVSIPKSARGWTTKDCGNIYRKKG
jgi:hypothetical protein